MVSVDVKHHVYLLTEGFILLEQMYKCGDRSVVRAPDS